MFSIKLGIYRLQKNLNRLLVGWIQTFYYMIMMVNKPAYWIICINVFYGNKRRILVL